MAFRQSSEVIEKHRKQRDEVRVLHGATSNSVHYELPRSLTSEEISRIIKEGTGQDEDAFQDAWLKVIEENISDPLEILIDYL